MEVASLSLFFSPWKKGRPFPSPFWNSGFGVSLSGSFSADQKKALEAEFANRKVPCKFVMPTPWRSETQGQRTKKRSGKGKTSMNVKGLRMRGPEVSFGWIASHSTAAGGGWSVTIAPPRTWKDKHLKDKLSQGSRAWQVLDRFVGFTIPFTNHCSDDGGCFPVPFGFLIDLDFQSKACSQADFAALQNCKATTSLAKSYKPSPRSSTPTPTTSEPTTSEPTTSPPERKQQDQKTAAAKDTSQAQTPKQQEQKTAAAKETSPAKTTSQREKKPAAATTIQDPVPKVEVFLQEEDVCKDVEDRCSIDSHWSVSINWGYAFQIAPAGGNCDNSPFFWDALGCVKPGAVGRGTRLNELFGCAKEAFVQTKEASQLQMLSAAVSTGTERTLAVTADGGIKERATQEGLNILSRYMKTGKISRPFCLGEKADCDRKDELRSIAGEAMIRSEAGARGRKSAKLAAQIKKITLGAIVYLGASSVDKGAAKTILGLLGDAGRVGLSKVELALLVNQLPSGQSTVSMRVQGSPYLGGKCKNVFTCALQKAGKSVVMRQELEYMPGTPSKTTVTSTFGSVPIKVSDKFRIEDSTGGFLLGGGDIEVLGSKQTNAPSTHTHTRPPRLPSSHPTPHQASDLPTLSKTSLAASPRTRSAPSWASRSASRASVAQTRRAAGSRSRAS